MDRVVERVVRTYGMMVNLSSEKNDRRGSA